MLVFGIKIENIYVMKFINDNKVNYISEHNLPHNIPNPSKKTKNVNIH